MAQPGKALRSLVLFALSTGWCVHGLGEDESIHVAFCAECKPDMDWKSAGLFHSFHTSGMRGRITRLLACSDEQLASYPKQALEMGPTYVHRNYRTHPRVPKDHSGSYNKVRRRARQQPAQRAASNRRAEPDRPRAPHQPPRGRARLTPRARPWPFCCAPLGQAASIMHFMQDVLFEETCAAARARPLSRAPRGVARPRATARA